MAFDFAKKDIDRLDSNIRERLNSNEIYLSSYLVEDISRGLKDISNSLELYKLMLQKEIYLNQDDLTLDFATLEELNRKIEELLQDA